VFAEPGGSGARFAMYPCMRIATPVWEQRISPVFDVAARLLIVEAHGHRLGARRERELTAADPVERVAQLVDWGVDILICGAVSRVIEQMLKARGVQVFARVCGDVDQVLDAYAAGELDARRFRLPGCGPADHQHRGGRGVWGGRRTRGRIRGRFRGRIRGRCGPESEAILSCEDIIVCEREASPAGDGPAPDGARAWIARVDDVIVGELVLRRSGDAGLICELDIASGWDDGPVPCRLLQRAIHHGRECGLSRLKLTEPVRARGVMRWIRRIGFQRGRGRGHGSTRSMEFSLDPRWNRNDRGRADHTGDAPTESRD
jgi:predicted Fe-Mo cluster-binding NifX family protein